jgi:hypothetical protein
MAKRNLIGNFLTLVRTNFGGADFYLKIIC